MFAVVMPYVGQSFGTLLRAGSVMCCVMAVGSVSMVTSGWLWQRRKLAIAVAIAGLLALTLTQLHRPRVTAKQNVYITINCDGWYYYADMLCWVMP